MTLSLLLQFLNFIHLKNIEQNANIIAIDNTGNIFIVEARYLFVYDTAGNKKNEYINKYLDDITSIDVSNPFKILLFYKNFNKIIFLSNKLTEIDKGVDLEDLNLYYIEAACNSSKNGFWVFDKLFKNPIFISNSLEIKVRGSSLSIDTLKTDTFNITMREVNEKLYICIPYKGLFIYNLQGDLIDYLNFNGLELFQVLNNNNFILQINRNLFLYNANTRELQQLKLSNISCFDFSNNLLVTHYNNKISIFKVK